MLLFYIKIISIPSANLGSWPQCNNCVCHSSNFILRCNVFRKLLNNSVFTLTQLTASLSRNDQRCGIHSAMLTHAQLDYRNMGIKQTKIATLHSLEQDLNSICR